MEPMHACIVQSDVAGRLVVQQCPAPWLFPSAVVVLANLRQRLQRVMFDNDAEYRKPQDGRKLRATERPRPVKWLKAAR